MFVSMLECCLIATFSEWVLINSSETNLFFEIELSSSRLVRALMVHSRLILFNALSIYRKAVKV